jgi:hypothetical protein
MYTSRVVLIRRHTTSSIDFQSLQHYWPIFSLVEKKSQPPAGDLPLPTYGHGFPSRHPISSGCSAPREMNPSCMDYPQAFQYFFLGKSDKVTRLPKSSIIVGECDRFRSHLDDKPRALYNIDSELEIAHRDDVLNIRV